MNFNLNNVSYRHPQSNTSIIDGLSLSLEPSPILLLGKNGAGKTTLLKLISGLIKPKSGRIQRNGTALYLPQKFIPVTGFNCMEYVSYVAWLNGRSRKEAKADTMQWLVNVGLEGLEKQSCQKLSGGQQARLALAMALNSGADLILLDEPGAALDPLSKENLRNLYQMVVEAGVNLVVSSHDPTDILGPFTRVVIIDHGVVFFDYSPEALRRGHHCNSLVAAFARSMFPNNGVGQ